MLHPQTNETRECVNLNGLWKFAADKRDEGLAHDWGSGLPDRGVWMPVPASYNDLTQDPALRGHVGAVWYEREAWVPRAWRGRRVVLRVGAASHHATVWWDGRKVTEHQGGFLPFEADLTELCGTEGPHRLVIRVDNRLSWQTLPPGVVRHDGDFPTSGSQPRQEYFHDFFNYAGIHRAVTLYSTPGRHIAAIRAIPFEENGGTGFDCAADVAGGGGKVKWRLLDEEGGVVTGMEGAAGRMSLSSPRRWNPGDPYLYTLEASLDSGDVYRIKTGFRIVEVDGDRFLINGREFYFKGFGKHEDSDFIGKGHSDAVMIKDFALLDWCGANSFRTSHYPYAEEILDHADRTGIVVIGEAPAVGFNFTPQHYRPLFHEGRVDENTRAHHLQTIREMIARDLHHPSIVAWSLANEAATQEPASRDYFLPVVEEARALDASRPVTIVMSAFPDADHVGDLVDFICVNRYYGWYHDVGRLETIRPNLEAELRGWHARYGKPLLLSEYGADALAGLHLDPAEMFSEEFQVEVLRETHAVLDRLPFIIGEHVWNFADFATSQGLKRAGGNKKGVFTRQRQPKLAAHELKKRWRSA